MAYIPNRTFHIFFVLATMRIQGGGLVCLLQRSALIGPPQTYSVESLYKILNKFY